MKKILHTIFAGLVELTEYDFGCLILILSIFWLISLLFAIYFPTPMTILCIIVITAIIILAFYFLKREIRNNNEKNNEKYN